MAPATLPNSPTSLRSLAATCPPANPATGPFAPKLPQHPWDLQHLFPQPSVPVGCHEEVPGASLSSLIASLALETPPPSSQKTAKVSWLQIFPGKGSGRSLAWGTATICRALPTWTSSALSPSDHSNSQRWLLHTQKSKADPGCHPLSPPVWASCGATPLVLHPLAPLRGSPLLPGAEQVGYHLGLVELPKILL